MTKHTFFKMIPGRYTNHSRDREDKRNQRSARERKHTLNSGSYAPTYNVYQEKQSPIDWAKIGQDQSFWERKKNDE